MPMPRRPHRALPAEIRIAREGEYAVIAYADEKIATTHFQLGAEKLAKMSDQDILDAWNEHIEARDAVMAEYEHVAVEVPPGRPQIEFFSKSNQWVPRGDVLRCVVMGTNGEDENAPFISIDDRDFTPMEFARMLSTFGGWGMRLVFVPDDELHDEPAIEVREPDPRSP